MTSLLRRAAAAALLVLAVAASAGCSSDDDGPDEPASSTPSPSPTTSPTPADRATTDATTTDGTTTDGATTGQPALPALVIRPGAIGDARVGMTRDEWSATGLFADGAAICEGELIHWRDDPDGTGLRVLTDEDATITQLWATRPGPVTDHGDLQVGSTYADLVAAFPTVTDPVDDGFDQSSVYPPGEEDGLPYLAFLLDAPAEDVAADTPIAAIAATGGEPAYFQFDC
ncbi:hypothetical protein FHP29_20040 [Nocardioides albidus]|uniref:Secreted protein n=1 Tax=Nocardioides albidus TaxID=1517589 RepID=A0A5C4VKR1_9ACTN|nr:hypothetical protein [Nocardioides albidus]TNM36433.1 hypothetical protein FHP29_20040 [Nocardioides albidus]